ncbi:MAG: ABC transporter ATP-binding protein [Rhodobiaceae bacterium]|nr:ABC transporter ATP-binding protein [Rhodobiaceae bacterium]
MILKLEEVTMRFGGFKAVDNVSLEVPEGALVGLIGPNGAGKSTLFANITGFLPADRGRIWFADRRIDGLKPEARARLGLGRTFQVPREFSHLTVRENLAASVPAQAGENLVDLYFRPGAVRRQEAEVAAAVDDMIAFLNLGAVADLSAGRLSGGQKKLLELGRALLIKPKFVLLDEPFGGVNAVLIDEISSRIRALNADGLGFLIVEHNLSALAELARDLFAMDNGRIIAHGTPDDVLADPAVRRSYMGEKV